MATPDDTIDAIVIPAAPLDSAETAAAKAIGRPWSPGESGNPKGRPPKHLSMTSALKGKAGDVCEFDVKLAERDGREPRTWLEVWIDTLAKEALKNPKALAMIFDRLEGKAKATVVHQGEVNHTGEINHVHEAAAQIRDHMIGNLRQLRERSIKKQQAETVLVLPAGSVEQLEAAR